MFNNNNECDEMTGYVQALSLAGSVSESDTPFIQAYRETCFRRSYGYRALLLILSRRLLLRAFAVVADVDILKAPFDEIVRVVRD